MSTNKGHGWDPTDRERLVLALDELHHTHDYWTANTADLICCGTCLAHQMAEGERETGAAGAVGWHIQHDEQAFGWGFQAVDWPDIPRVDVPICPRCTELNDESMLIPDDDEAAQDAWHAVRWDHVLADHHRLLRPLDLLVYEDRDLVAAVLRRHGLHAETDPGPALQDPAVGWVHVTSDGST